MIEVVEPFDASLWSSNREKLRGEALRVSETLLHAVDRLTTNAGLNRSGIANWDGLPESAAVLLEEERKLRDLLKETQRRINNLEAAERAEIQRIADEDAKAKARARQAKLDADRAAALEKARKRRTQILITIAIVVLVIVIIIAFSSSK
jgi:hypothetical protein